MLTTEIIRKTEAGFKPASKLDDGPEWFADIRRRARASATGLLSEIVILSPDRAKALLAANPENRKLSEMTVDTYAADIANGHWVFNGEPIIVSDTGELNDGQHRCAAVIVSGRAIEVLLVAGIARAARTTTDMGKARSVGDFLAMHGITGENNVAAAASLLHAIESRKVMQVGRQNGDIWGSNQRPTKAFILSFAKENMTDIRRAMKAINALKAAKVGTFSRTAGILAALARASHDWEDAERFVQAVVDGDNIKSGSPEYVLRERLIAEKQARKLSPSRNIELFIRAWNAHRCGTRISRITLANNIPDIAV